MGTPSSQVVAAWVKDHLDNSDWTPLDSICLEAVQKNWGGISESDAYDFVEKNLPYVADHLRDEASECKLDGIPPSFEIDDEQRPYIKQLVSPSKDILTKLRHIDPFDFEIICAKILSELGAKAFSTQKSNDGGVDFVGTQLKIVPTALAIPTSCQATVIGQAKRYKDGNIVRQTSLREFVGASSLRRHQMIKEGNVGLLAPCLFAFWTTSDFDPGAKSFAREAGLWYMEGRTLADYVECLRLRSFVMSFKDM